MASGDIKATFSLSREASRHVKVVGKKCWEQERRQESWSERMVGYEKRPFRLMLMPPSCLQLPRLMIFYSRRAMGGKGHSIKWKVPFTINGFYFLLRPSEDLIECSSNWHFLARCFQVKLFSLSTLKIKWNNWNGVVGREKRKDTAGHKVSVSFSQASAKSL